MGACGGRWRRGGGAVCSLTSLTQSHAVAERNLVLALWLTCPAACSVQVKVNRERVGVQ